MLRDVGEYRGARSALVSGAVDGGHAIPVTVVGPHRSITIRRGEQQIGGDQLAVFVFLSHCDRRDSRPDRLRD